MMVPMLMLILVPMLVLVVLQYLFGRPSWRNLFQARPARVGIMVTPVMMAMEGRISHHILRHSEIMQVRQDSITVWFKTELLCWLVCQTSW